MQDQREERAKDYKRIIRRNRVKRRVYLLCLLIAGIICFLLFTPYFGVVGINISGNSPNVDHAAILEASGIRIGDNLFRISAKKVENQVLSLPYVKSVKIVRGFPNAMEINIVERIPIAYLKSDYGEYFYIDNEGVVMCVMEMPPEGISLEIQGILPEDVVVGAIIAEKNSKILEKYLATIEQIVDNGMTEEISIINLHNGEKISMRYNRLDVVLGDQEEISYKFGMLKSILNEIGEKASGKVDLTTGERSYYTPQ